MAVENFLLNFDANLAPLEAKFQAFVAKANTASAQIANIKLPTLPQVTPANVQQAGQQAGIGRQGIRESGRLSGIDPAQTESLVNQYNKLLKKQIADLSVADQKAFAAAANESAREAKKLLSGIKTQDELQDRINSLLGVQASAVADNVAETKKPVTTKKKTSSTADAAQSKAEADKAKADKEAAKAADLAAKAAERKAKAEAREAARAEKEVERKTAAAAREKARQEAAEARIAKAQEREALAAEKKAQEAARITEINTRGVNRNSETFQEDVEITKANTLYGNAIQAEVQSSRDVVESNTEVARVNRLSAAEKAKTLASDKSLQLTEAEAKRDVQVSNEQVKQGLLVDRELTAEKAETRRLQTVQNNNLKAKVAVDEEVVRSAAELAANQKLQAEIARKNAIEDPVNRQARDETRVAKVQDRTRSRANPEEQQALLADNYAKQVQVARNNLDIQSRIAGVNNEELKASGDIVKIKNETSRLSAQNAAAQAEIRKAARLEIQASNQKSASEIQAVARQQAVAAIERQKLTNAQKTIEIELALDQASIEQRAQQVVTQRQLTKAYNKQLAAAFKAQGQNADALKASLGFYDPAGGAGGKGGAGQGFFAGGALTTLKYTLPSLALYGGGSLLLDSLNEAEELERKLLTLKSQLESTQGPGQAVKEFERLRDIIKDTAVNTGLAGDEVADLAIQFQGAFGAGSGREIDGISGTDLVEKQIEASAKFARISALDDSVVFNNFSATSLAFGELATTIGDTAFAAQDALGVSADEITNFLGKIAPAAADAGFSLEEFTALAATAQQASGASSDVLAEQFGRILPAISGNRDALLELAAVNDTLNQAPFLEAIATNDTAGIIKFLIANFQDLNKEIQSSVIELLGGRREAGALLAVFENSDAYTKTLDALGDSAGRLEVRFQAFSGTFKQQLAVLSESFKQLVLALLDAGLADAISFILNGFIDITKTVKGLVDVMGRLVEPLKPFLDTIKQINKALDGMPIKILAIAQAAKVTGATKVGAAALTAASAGGTISGSAGTLASAGLPASLAARSAAPNIARLGAPGAAAAGALSIPAVAFATVAAAALATVAAYNRIVTVQNENAANVEDLRAKLADATREDLEQIVANADSGAIGNFGNAIFGIKDPADVAQELLDKMNAEGSTAQIKEVLYNYEGGLSAYIDVIANDDNNVDLQDAFIAALEANQLNTDDLAKINERFSNFTPELIRFRDRGNGDPIIDAVDEQVFKKEELINSLIAAAEAGDVEAQTILNIISSGLSNKPIVDAFSEIVAGREPSINKAIDELANSSQSIDEAQAAYDAGSGSLAQLLAAYDNAQEVSNTAIELALNTEGADPQAIIDSRNENAATRAELYSKAILKEVEFTNSIIELREGDTTSSIDSRRQNLIALLNDPKFTDADSRSKIADTIIQLTEGFNQASIDALDDGEEKIALIRSGSAIDPSARVELLLQQLNQNNLAFAEFSDAYKTVYEKTTDGFTRALVTALALGEAGQAFAQTLIEGAINDARRAINDSIRTGDIAGINDATALIEELRGLQGAQTPADIFNIEDITNVGADPALATAEAKKAAEAAAKKAADDATERERAAQELADAQNAYLLALVEGDPVRAAQERIRQADAAIAGAKNDAERINGEIEKLRSERALEDAFRAISDAQVNLLIAQAEAGGDVVEAARLRTQQAAEKLAQAQADFASGKGGEASVKDALGGVVQAEASQRDVELQKKIDDYEYLYEIGDITKQQLVAYLTQLKQIPGLIPDQLKDLDRKIRSLNSELGQDLQFNLPTNIKLPTLYETRRLDQTGGTNANGIGYQDNRQISVELVVNGNTDPETLVQMLDSYLGNDRSSVSVRRY